MLNRIYIGSNNKTGRLEYEKVVAITAKEFNGFTAIKTNGYWKSKLEKSIVIEIETEEKNKVKDLIKTLARALNQESIGWAIIGKMDFIGA